MRRKLLAFTFVAFSPLLLIGCQSEADAADLKDELVALRADYDALEAEFGTFQEEWSAFYEDWSTFYEEVDAAE